jgi:hypothetical protein
MVQHLVTISNVIYSPFTTSSVAYLRCHTVQSPMKVFELVLFASCELGRTSYGWCSKTLLGLDW